MEENRIDEASEEKQIVEALKEWLAEPGNTQVIAAQRIGIGETALRDRLHGRTRWKFGEARRVARLTGKELTDFE